MRTRLINLRGSDESDYVFIGRPSKFGNPYIIGKDGNRDTVCKLYEYWFEQAIELDEDFKQAVHKLKGKTLACYCKPKKCHGDTIIRYLNDLP